MNEANECEQRVGAAIAGIGDTDGTRDQAPTIYATVELRADYNFAEALLALKRGCRVTRRGWNGKGMYLELQRPDKGSKMTRPYIFMKTADNDLVPWVASQSDLLSADWAILPR